MAHLLASPRPGPLHRLPAGAKLAAALALVLLVVLLPADSWPAYGGIAAVLLALVVVSRVAPRELARRLLWVEPFAVSVAVLALLQPGGGRVFLVLLTKSTLCLSAMVLLGATTRFTDLLQVLRHLLPALLVTTLALAHRYLFVLAEESVRLRRARRSRTFSDRRRLAWHGLASVAAQLFVRVSERADRIYAAMCARGWTT